MMNLILQVIAVQRLYPAVKDKNIKLKQVKEWLSGQPTYTLHRDARKHYDREKIFVSQPLEQYQADLVDMQMYSRFNNGYRYILTVIDCFSRYAFAQPVKNKRANEIINAFKVIFQHGRPFKLQTDRGLEFKNKHFKEFLEQNNIHYFNTYNTEFKCAIVERFNRTLKNKMHKYFTANSTKRYIDVLQNLVNSYNNSKHRTIGVAPSEVNESNTQSIFEKIYNVKDTREYFMKHNVKQTLKEGDKVRRKYVLNSMDKGYLPKWTDHIYTIKRTIGGNKRPLYKITNDDGQEIKERLYPEEVQKVKENFYRIEKIIRKEDRDGRKGFIVKWIDHPAKYKN